MATDQPEVEEWAPCNCGSRWPADAPEEGMCSPFAKDHDLLCPRGRFLASREARIQAEVSEEAELELAADSFGREAREAFVATGSRAGALDRLRIPALDGLYTIV